MHTCIYVTMYACTYIHTNIVVVIASALIYRPISICTIFYNSNFTVPNQYSVALSVENTVEPKVPDTPSLKKCMHFEDQY